MLYAAAVAVAVALVAVTALFAAGGGVSADPTAALKKAGCTYKVVTAMKAGVHITPECEAELEHLPAVQLVRTTRSRQSGASTPTLCR
jgi:hypothetical protein